MSDVRMGSRCRMSDSLKKLHRFHLSLVWERELHSWGENRYSVMVDIITWLDFSWTSLSLWLYICLFCFYSSDSLLFVFILLSCVITTRVEDRPIVWDWPLKRMKAQDPGNVISKHNYISNGSPSMDDLKWYRALAGWGIAVKMLWTETFENNLQNI